VSRRSVLALQVCSNKMEKTVVVIVEIRNWVNKYRTWHTKLRKYMAHDMQNTCNIGDVVKIEQIPQKLSKRKAFNVIEVLQRENVVIEDSDKSAPQQSLAAQFTKRPQWAGLSPVLSEEIMGATASYASYYEISDAAHELARKLPGWDEKVVVYRSMYIQQAPVNEDAGYGDEDSNVEVGDSSHTPSLS
jgi:small subunit ribosomal protein S17